MLAATIVEPTGVENNIDVSSPNTAHSTEIIAERITTPLKFWINLMDDRAGNIIKADIRSEPTRFIASTIITAVITAISRLYLSAFMPLAFAKLSSKVTANILL